jgi:hypothetical protein
MKMVAALSRDLRGLLMRYQFKIALCTALSGLALGAQAHAATIVLNNGQPYDEMVHANSAGSGTTLDTLTKPGGYHVNLISADGISVGGGNGVAIVSGLGGGQGAGFNSLFINPLVNFSVMQFKIDDFGGKVKGDNFDLLVNFVGGGSQTFLNYSLPSNSKIDIFAGLNEVLDSIVVSDLRGAKGESLKFKDIKQISFDAVRPVGGIPEPATWGMMILGIGLTGGVMRRKQKPAVRFAI